MRTGRSMCETAERLMAADTAVLVCTTLAYTRRAVLRLSSSRTTTASLRTPPSAATQQQDRGCAGLGWAHNALNNINMNIINMSLSQILRTFDKNNRF